MMKKLVKFERKGVSILVVWRKGIYVRKRRKKTLGKN